nr:RNA-directed DNA polymerase, eukaryota [Tanacetum cinerariifolium]
LRDQAYENSLIYKEKTKKIYDSKIKNRIFNVGDRVLLFNSHLRYSGESLKLVGQDLLPSPKFFLMGPLSYLNRMFQTLRNARGGLEEHLLADLTSLIDSVTLSNSGDRWVCDLVSDGNFRVKEIRNYIDDLFLPHQAAPTRWIKYIPIKVNIFAWQARQDCLSTRVNLIRRGITIESSHCPVCSTCEEDVYHIFFHCDLAQLVLRCI